MASQLPPDTPPPPAAAPSFSISLGPAKPKPPPRKSAPTFAPKRSAAHLDSDDDEHHDDEHAAKVQLVTGFDTTRGGALDLDDAPKETRGPLVIPKQSNRNWREEAERRRGGYTKKPIYLPPEALAKQNGAVQPEDLVELDAVEQKFGLQVFERAPEDAVAAEASPATAPVVPQTEEELALASLLRGDAPAPSTLVLAPVPAAAGNDWRSARAAIVNEDAAFKTDVASRPEMASLEDYAAVPVEEFGAALLRGMGWKEGDEVGKRRGAASKPRVVEKRPAFLGIGAKAKEEVPELGTWGKGDKRRRGRRPDTTYVPVIMVDKKTGRVVDPAEADAIAAATAATNGVAKGEEKGDRERQRDRDKEQPKRERSRDRNSRIERTERRDRERSYDSSDRRRRDRGGRDSGRERDKDSGRDRERSNRKDDERDRRRGDDRKRDERRDRDRRDRR